MLFLIVYNCTIVLENQFTRFRLYSEHSIQNVYRERSIQNTHFRIQDVKYKKLDNNIENTFWIQNIQDKG